MMFKAIAYIFILLAVPSAGFSQTPTGAAPRRLELEECLKQALAKHPLLAASRARVQGAQELRRYAGLRPNPSLTVQTENWRFTGAPSFAPARDLDLFIYGTQTIETARKATRRAEMAESGVGLADAEVQAVRWRIQQEVTRSFYRALQAQVAFEIISENRLNLDRLREYTALRVREGFSAQAELVRARLEQQTLLNAEAVATQEFERARLELLRTMGEQSFDTGFTVAAGNVMVSSLPPLDLINSEAMERRPDLLALRAKLTQARSTLRLTQAETRPDWDVSFGYKRTARYNTMIASVSVPLPIFNRKLGAAGQA
ncbi:MAG: TolC family protein, partial [Acidobacteriota bacterium]|nr:TolC family protein [Acidobacteriota bacterium]